MRRATLLAAATLILDASCAIVQKRAPTNHGWERRSLTPKDNSIKLHIAVRHADDGEAIERQLALASDPNSPSFRQHVSAEEAARLSEPTRENVHEVEEWLWEHDLLEKASLFGGIFEIDTTIQQAEQLLNTTYSTFSDGWKEINRAELYHLPKAVADCIDFVTPTTSFPQPGDAEQQEHAKELLRRSGHIFKRQQNNTECTGADGLATPSCIRRVYDINFDGLNYTAQPNRTTFAVYATESASFNNSDLQAYLREYNPAAAQASASYELVGSGGVPDPGIAAKFETSLGTQALLGLAYPEVQNGIFYNYGGVFGPEIGQTYDNFVTFLQQLLSNETVPSVISITESANENLFDPDYARRLCLMMAQIGARGVSLLFSTGNNGANGQEAGGEHKTIFEPKFPASCPWVTAVGGTTNIGDEEAAVNGTIPIASSVAITASGGGFSNLFARPRYQANQVQSYIDQYVPKTYENESGFNSSGRGYPDVAAFSTQYPTFVDGFMLPIGGTSASTPTWAAIISLLNDYEAFHGRPPLGFLNPWLYSLNGTGLKDIVKGGENVGACSAAQGCMLEKVLGYNTTEGWDAVTGLGSPRFRELVRVLDGGRIGSDEEFTSVVSSAAAEITATATTSDGAATSTAAAASRYENRVQAAFLGIGALVLAAV
ncbi:Tripeptidyl-peptidase sed2 [Cercospora beticola]|uniref:Tripeptidyl-peptidase sed2 n=1 Tax=Cercospora beticola TaxID=122368 RepID=A0A2G5IAU1_CERBT|nr:Tripeptidyl-peptidase sed2 [Cercospora beticola]PIB01915.1 Tripeptidyl-peptidase sed2 [Cercospora beticola]WPA97690.1 hypothetical protein RHO25_002301 [Cercospora beticola]